MHSVLVILHEGCEEIEAITPIDLLRRAGFAVKTASASSDLVVKGGRGIEIKADVKLSDVTGDRVAPFDLVVLPGGPGVSDLRQNLAVRAWVQNQARGDGKLAAICAAPLVLADAGILSNRRVTSFPGSEAEMRPLVGGYSQDRVVIDGNLCTSRGAGTAEEFSLALIAWLAGPEAAQKVRHSIVART
jgi:4-methyl-5(b-hydroxyethyl)-thiazole monophosphate biosynthesis